MFLAELLVGHARVRASVRKLRGAWVGLQPGGWRSDGREGHDASIKVSGYRKNLIAKHRGKEKSMPETSDNLLSYLSEVLGIV